METIDFGFYKWEKEHADKPFLKQPFGDRWETYTWGEAGQMARKLANGLRSLGLPEKSHIGLVSKNCREWIIADLAIMMAGYVSVPLYSTLSSEQINEVIKLGDIAALFVGKLEVWDEMKKGVPNDMPIIAFPHYEGNVKVTEGKQWNDFINQFEPLVETSTLYADDTWTIVFTSGTTGTPKGVVITYGAMDSTKIVVEQNNVLDISLNGANRFFSFLPLNHIAERVVIESTCLKYGGTISFSESLARFPKNLQDTQATILFAVPRIFTKFQLGILSKMPQKKLDTLLKIPFISGIIKKKLQKALGLDQCRGIITGAAPMSESVKAWYRKIGVYINEGYGMTENCALTTVLKGKDIKIGSVGKAQPGVELKIDQESEEILMKAPYMMSGYYKDPEKTAEVIRDGWLHTGDQGRIDQDGYLYITGRVKDTFKTAKGKFIVPAPLEWNFSGNHDIDQICIAGLGCPQPIALIVPSEIGMAKSQKELKESFENTLKNVNDKLPSYQKISTIVLVKDAWSIDNGMLTPTLKVKRNKIHQKYKDTLLNWHEDKELVIME